MEGYTHDFKTVSTFAFNLGIQRERIEMNQTVFKLLCCACVDISDVTLLAIKLRK